MTSSTSLTWFLFLAILFLKRNRWACAAGGAAAAAGSAFKTGGLTGGIGTSSSAGTSAASAAASGTGGLTSALALSNCVFGGIKCCQKCGDIVGACVVVTVPLGVTTVHIKGDTSVPGRRMDDAWVDRYGLTVAPEGAPWLAFSVDARDAAATAAALMKSVAVGNWGSGGRVVLEIGIAVAMHEGLGVGSAARSNAGLRPSALGADGCVLAYGLATALAFIVDEAFDILGADTGEGRGDVANALRLNLDIDLVTKKLIYELFCSTKTLSSLATSSVVVDRGY